MVEPIPLFLAGLAIAALGGVAALIAGRHAATLGAGSAILGALLALVPAVGALSAAAVPTLQRPWSLPGGSLALAIDPLSAFFLIPTLVLAALAALYGVEYLRPEAQRSLGPAWCCYNLLVVSMALVLVAQDGLLFLLAWEAMALASFFLVAFEHERAAVRRAAWTYLVATHLGTACLLALFVLQAGQAGSFEFARVAAAGPGPAAPGLLFLLALVGFGAKAGFVPLHVWLPEAHPAAPSHVSALLSGVMIKTGIYGLLRILTLLGPPAPWWGWCLVGIGITSGILGVLFALAQHDLKRLLAYHSVENIGIITLGLGLGTLGVAAGMPALATLGFAGGLLHVLNHALFKGLLFLGAGAVLRGGGSRDLERLGGLQRRMPWTGACFLVGAAAISGLPPLNGFVSEFLIALAALGVLPAPGGAVSPLAAALATLGALGLIGGLAAACFAKAFGTVFLGEPRSARAAEAREVGLAMRLPMLALAGACAAIGVLAPIVPRALAPVLGVIARVPAADLAAPLAQAAGALARISAAGVGLVLTALALGLWRRRLLAKRAVEATGTWDCGYARPTARMQYTASSFAQPMAFLFRALLRTRVVSRPVEGLFPAPAAFATETPDLFREQLFGPVFAAVERLLARLRVLQHGRIQLYVLSIVLTLVVLLAWRLG